MTLRRAMASAWMSALFAAAVLPGAALAQHAHAPPMARTQLANAMPDTVLVDQEGRRFAFKELRGKAVLFAFIYTSCHHVCPLILESVSAVQARARSEGLRELHAVFVTVDPEIDTPPILKTYAVRRGADFATTVFLTGTSEELQVVWDAFGLKITQLGRGLVDHPPFTFLADAQGTVRYRYLGAVLDSDAVLADLRAVVRSARKN